MGSDDDGRKVKAFSTCEWTPDAVSCLLDRYGEKYALGRGYLRNRDWEEVVSGVNSRCEGQRCPKTMKQCRDKVDSLKKRYKMEKRRIVSAGVLSSSWPFFAKLDEIMASVPKHSKLDGIMANPLKQARLLSNPDAWRSVSPVEQEPPDSFNEKLEETPSPQDIPTDSASRECVHRDSSAGKGKTVHEDLDGLSEDDLNTPSTSQKRVLDTQESLDDGSYQEKVEQLSEKTVRLLAKKKRQRSSHPMQALADALVGFSDVYARIELAKMEIYTNMQLEIAKLSMKRKSRKRKSAPSSYSDSR